MFGNIIQINYLPGDNWIETGFRRGQYPSGCYHGGNGTYRCFSPADIEVVAMANGRRLSFRIGYDVKNILGCRQLRRSLFERVRNANPGTVDLVRSNGRWEICDEDLRDWLESI